MSYKLSKLTKPQLYKLSVLIFVLLYTYVLASMLPKSINSLFEKGLLGIIVMASLIYISTHSFSKAFIISITFFTFMSIANSDLFFPKKTDIENLINYNQPFISDYTLLFENHMNPVIMKSKNDYYYIESYENSNTLENINTITNMNTINNNVKPVPYNKIGEYQTFTNTPSCDNIKSNNMNDAIKACNKCDACDGISQIGNDYILGQRPVEKITMYLKPTEPGKAMELPPIILPGATDDITKKILPNCKARCNPQDLSFEFNQKRKQFFGLDQNTPNIDTININTTYTDGIFTPPTQGGSKWEADQTYTKLPVNLNKCTISYPIDNNNNWKMDAYLDPNSNCDLRVLAQNPTNIYNNQQVSLTDAYGGNNSMFGPIAFE